MVMISGVDLDREVDMLRHRRPCVALAVGVVRNGAPGQVVVRGLADIESGRPATAEVAFRVASITKTFTAMAIMQLRDRGIVDLDAPANDYLRGFRLGAAEPGPRAASVRQLLTHTGGLPEVFSPWSAIRPDFGESVPAGQPVPALSTLYRGTLRSVTDPGTTFCYTNHGFAALGQIVEDVTDVPFGGYLSEHVFGPWGMAGTDLLQSRRPAAGCATGYHLTSRGPKPAPFRDMATVGAAAAWSTPIDMLRYIEAILGGGTNRHGSALNGAAIEEMLAPQFQPDHRLPGIGLAFFRGELGGRRIVEHQGVIPGFDSHLIIAPDDGVGVFVAATGARQGMFWLPTEAARLVGRLIGAPEEGVRTDLQQHPEVWPQLCGLYTIPGEITDLRIRSIVGAGVQVLVRRGRLVLRCLNPVPLLFRGVELFPDAVDDPYVFRFDLSGGGLGTTRVAFAPDRVTGRMAAHLEVMPLTAYRRSRDQPAAVRQRDDGGEAVVTTPVRRGGGT